MYFRLGLVPHKYSCAGMYLHKIFHKSEIMQNMSTWWLWPLSLQINTLAWHFGFARWASCGLFTSLLFGLYALEFTLQHVVGSFSKDGRFFKCKLKYWFLQFFLLICIFGLFSDGNVGPLLGVTILRIIKVFRLQHVFVWLRSLVAQAIYLLRLISVVEETELLLLHALTCNSLSWRCFCIWKWAWPDQER